MHNHSKFVSHLECSQVFGIMNTPPPLSYPPLSLSLSQAKMIIQAAYGSQRHLAVYTELLLQRDQIYILYKKTNRKEAEDCQVSSSHSSTSTLPPLTPLTPLPLSVWSQVIGGYLEHVQELVKQRQRPALSSVIPLLGKDTCFALPGKQKPERRRRKSRTGSHSPRRLSPKLSHRHRDSKETTV